MCGIFGYIGPLEAISMVIEGIKHLEYRGYDSSGVAGICNQNQKLVYEKEVGKVAQLEKKTLHHRWDCRVAISHTRWATNGKPTAINAHPHIDEAKKLAIVHNGIIENDDSLRKELEKKGLKFDSETDSEVIAQLISYHYEGDFLSSVQKSLPLLKGTFALAIIHRDHPGQIICAARESPLAIGLGQGEMFIASDPRAFLKYTKRAIYLHQSEVAVISSHSFEIFDESTSRISKESLDLGFDAEKISKGNFEHYMLKEIYEQPQTVLNALLSRYSEDYGTAVFEELLLSDEELLGIERIVIVACGTSWHAGLIGAYMIEERARIPVQVEISSEFRYKNPIVQEKTLGIAISQSGETADTLAALRELKAKGAKVIGICNAQGSTMTREVDSCLFLRAGPEIGVASTKAFTSQLVVLTLFMLRLARMRTMGQKDGKHIIQSLENLPQQIQILLTQEEAIKRIAKKYARYENFFFLGRRFMYPTALEGALKLKEIAYVNANGYPGGEIKHGPIALISPECPSVAFTSDVETYAKMVNNLNELKARNGPVLAIATRDCAGILDLVDDVIWVPFTISELAPILSGVAAQLFAYHVALARGTEIDQPRNLAKSVTVE